MTNKNTKTFAQLETICHLGSTNTRYVFMSAFASLVGIPIGIMSSAIRLKICTIIAAIKIYKSIIKKKKKKHNKIVF